MKKKLFATATALAISVCMVVPAFACTPTLKPPKVPTVPEIKVKVELPDSIFENWFKGHPVVIDWANVKLD